MNQRIKELSNQAYSYASEQTGEFTPEFMGFYDKKFAELIAKECLNLCKEVEDEMSDIYTGDELDATQVGARYCYEAILSEFGIEE